MGKRSRCPLTGTLAALKKTNRLVYEKLPGHPLGMPRERKGHLMGNVPDRERGKGFGRVIMRTGLAGAAVAAMSMTAPSAAGAQEVGVQDAQGCSVWMCMYTSGYPAGWNMSSTSHIPAGQKNFGHFEFWGPNGAHWNSPDRYNPAASFGGTGGGQVCSRLWLKDNPGANNWTYHGTVCHNVY